MMQTELTQSDGGLIIVNFDYVKSFRAVKEDDPNSGTELQFSDDKTLIVKEPYKEICKIFTITMVKINPPHKEK